jgi:hypothetical protein
VLLTSWQPGNRKSKQKELGQHPPFKGMYPKPGVVEQPVILALGRDRLESHEFEASLGYTVRYCLKNSKG